jgi:ribosomal protein S18 acetylase RimI-like enzyme
MIKVSKVGIRDMGHVTTLEVAIQEFPLLIDELKTYFVDDNKAAYAAHIGSKTVGYVLVTLNKDVMTINSVGVHPKFRRAGIGSRLIRELGFVAQVEVEVVKTIRMFVASYLIEDKEDPWNIEQWLWRTEFKTRKIKHETLYR